MSYEVRITDTTTGETRTIFRDEEWDEAAEYMWTEGNYSCDCNRGILFHNTATGDHPCGDARYTVTLPAAPLRP